LRWQKRTAQNLIGNRHIKRSLAFYALNRLRIHRVKLRPRPHLNYLFLLTMLADDGQQDVPFIRRGHLIPPADSVRRRIARQSRQMCITSENSGKARAALSERDVVLEGTAFDGQTETPLTVFTHCVQMPEPMESATAYNTNKSASSGHRCFRINRGDFQDQLPIGLSRTAHRGQVLAYVH